jgi:formylglycine-generating enzyme required for sulfatase activity/dienelactone hydrolase
VTPLTHTVDAPRGPLRVRVTKPGFRAALFVVANPGPSVANDEPNRAMINRGLAPVPLPLAAEGTLPDDMVLVPRTNIPVNLGGWTPDRAGNFALDMPAFGIGRHEVTNAQFKQFIDAGGYDNPALWQGLRFEEQGRVLGWEDARKRFVDATSRPGPAGWQLSTYPSGQADFPVGGISWYEAVAYARYRGEELPTIHHWLRAAFAPYDIHFNVTPAVAVSSRFYAQAPTSALDPVGLGAWGTYHTNGNVREWVWNFAGTKAVALGGAWPDYALDNAGAYTVPPMSRLPTHGMRLMHSLPGSTTPAAWREPIQLAYEQSTPHREPVSDEAFAVMRSQFSTAHPRPRNVAVTRVRETPLWVAERVLLEFEDQESVPLYVVRPKVRARQMQPVLYGPPQNCCVIKRANDNVLEQLVVSEFVVNSGRMLVMPIWWGSYERWVSETLSPAALQDLQREQALAWHRDSSATIDYLQSRADVDPERIGYLGFSRGASHYASVLALEPRIRVAVLISGGISTRPDVNPMVDLTHYAPRIHFPVLMINGKFDHIAPYERSQRRLFDLLGTPAGQKKHIVYDGGHFQYPLNSVAHDSTDWFDQYLGAAR